MRVGVPPPSYFDIKGEIPVDLLGDHELRSDAPAVRVLADRITVASMRVAFPDPRTQSCR